MLNDRLEPQWIDAFQRVFELCQCSPDETVTLLAETQSRALNIELARLALARLGVAASIVVVPTPPQAAPVPVRSTGATQ
ncbi:MAG: peptidase M29, partial [Gammaproteobacteria bacterium]